MKGCRERSCACIRHGGRYGTSRVIVARLEERFPLDTQMQSLWLPAIQAQLALNKKNPTSALTNLQAASSIELEQIQFVINISCSAERHTWQREGDAH
jgi:hypothetical protein